MSTPIDHEMVSPLNCAQSALNEIVSAQSSLNMHPDPIAVPGRDAPENGYYLSEVDGNAKHAMEHLRAAFALVNKAHQAQESLKTQVYQLVVQLQQAGMQPKIKTWLDKCDRCNEVDVERDEIFCERCKERMELDAADDAERREMEACAKLEEEKEDDDA